MCHPESKVIEASQSLTVTAEMHVVRLITQRSQVQILPPLPAPATRQHDPRSIAPGVMLVGDANQTVNHRAARELDSAPQES